MPEERVIRVLDDNTINQIAAGEVIENAASVVKELVENALDAKANNIRIETKAGGRGLIRITDNGCGMSRDNLLLSLERHATSKIANIDDISSINSLGFRGEALASIGSVSKMVLHSSFQSSEEGVQVHVDGGKIRNVIISPRTIGTTIEIRSLFFNVPVRKKFQKSIARENAEIHKTLTKLALSSDNVSFTWINDEKKEISVDKSTPFLHKIKALLGDEFANSLIEVNSQEEGISITGFISPSSINRPNRTGQHLILNGRAVVCPFVSHSVLEGYQTRLANNRYPQFVIQLKIPPSWIDVNVHPQKREVRIRQEQKIGIFITKKIEKALQKTHESVVVSSTQSFSFPPSSPVDLSAYETRPSLNSNETSSLFSNYTNILGKLGKYFLMENALFPNAILVVDKQAARSRIIFEKFVEKLEQDIPISTQQLLLPLNFEFAGSEKKILLDNLEMLNTLGISIRNFGGNTFIVDAIPSIIDIDEVEDFIQVLIDEKKEIDRKKMLTILCRKMKGGSLSCEEIANSLFKCRVYDETPDGKATFFQITELELNKKFEKK